MNISEFSQKPTSGATYAKNEVPPFVITTNRTLLAILSIGNEIVFKGIYAPDFNGQISIDFRGLYDDYLKTIIPTTGIDEITHTEYRRQFTATFEVVVGEDTPNFTKLSNLVFLDKEKSIIFGDSLYISE